MTANIIIFIGVVLSACLLIFICDMYINSRIKGKTQTDHAPPAVYVLKACCFLMVSIIIHETLEPLQSLSRVLPASYSGGDLIIHTVMYFSLFLAVCTIITLSNIWITGLLLGILLKGRNFYLEACNDNIGITLLFGAVIIGLAVAGTGGISVILDSMLPYPSTPVYR